MHCCEMPREPIHERIGMARLSCRKTTSLDTSEKQSMLTGCSISRLTPGRLKSRRTNHNNVYPTPHRLSGWLSRSIVPQVKEEGRLAHASSATPAAAVSCPPDPGCRAGGDGAWQCERTRSRRKCHGTRSLHRPARRLHHRDPLRARRSAAVPSDVSRSASAC